MDNGREFFSFDFDSFCAGNGIDRIKIFSFTPQENGVVERMNRKILAKSHCMLSNASLGKHFWVDTCKIVVYLINQSPSS